MKFYIRVCLVTFLCCLALIGCKSNRDNQLVVSVNLFEEQDVTITNMLSDSVYYKKLSNKTEKDFIYKEIIFYPNFYNLKIGDNNFTIVALPGDEIHINQIGQDKWSISGSVDTRDFYNIQQQLIDFRSEMNSYKSQFLNGLQVANVDSLRSRLHNNADSLFVTFKQGLINYISQNRDHLSCLLALRMKYDDEQSVLNSIDDFYLFKEVDRNLFSKYPEVDFVRQFHREVERVENQIALRNLNKMVLLKGDRMFYFSLPDTARRQNMINIYGSKYTFINFIKSSIDADYINLLSDTLSVNTLNRVNLINIWVEDDFNKWKQFVSKYKFAGIQLCDTVAPDSTSVCKKLGVNALPTGLLVNRYGRIVSSHMRFENVLDTINKIEKP